MRFAMLRVNRFVAMLWLLISLFIAVGSEICFVLLSFHLYNGRHEGNEGYEGQGDEEGNEGQGGSSCPSDEGDEEVRSEASLFSAAVSSDQGVAVTICISWSKVRMWSRAIGVVCRLLQLVCVEWGILCALCVCCVRVAP